MKQYILKIGDKSNDGHGEIETFTINVNKDNKEIIEAYEKSRTLTGLSFQENEIIMVGEVKINWNHPEYNLRRICVKYNNTLPTKFAIDILNKFRIECDVNKIEKDNKEFVNLLFNFIKLSLPDFEWNFENDNRQILQLNTGYGLFYQ